MGAAAGGGAYRKVCSGNVIANLMAGRYTRVTSRRAAVWGPAPEAPPAAGESAQWGPLLCLVSYLYFVTRRPLHLCRGTALLSPLVTPDHRISAAGISPLSAGFPAEVEPGPRHGSPSRVRIRRRVVGARGQPAPRPPRPAVGRPGRARCGRRRVGPRRHPLPPPSPHQRQGGCTHAARFSSARASLPLRPPAANSPATATAPALAAGAVLRPAAARQAQAPGGPVPHAHRLRRPAGQGLPGR